MYDLAVATRKTKDRPAPPPVVDGEETVVISSFRVSRRAIDAFDAWVVEQNVGRRGPKLTRTDMLRALIDWAAEQKPDWEK